MRRALLLASLLAAGCLDFPLHGHQATDEQDLAVQDLAVQDLGEPDLAVPDLLVADLAVVVADDLGCVASTDLAPRPTPDCDAGACELFTASSASGWNQIYGVQIADVDHDGSNDIVIEHYNGITVLYGEAGSSTSTAGFERAAIATDLPLLMAGAGVVADLNGDALLDIAVPREVTDPAEVDVYLQSAKRVFGHQVITGVGGAGDSTSAIAFGDVDGDGDRDLLALDYNFGTAGLLLNDGAGTFSLSTPLLDLGTSGGLSVVLADLIGTGALDLLVSGNYSPLVLRQGNGDGTWAASGAALATGASPVPVLADLDRDCTMDIVTADKNVNAGGDLTGSITVLLNPGGTPSAPKTIAMPAAPDNIAVADLDGDGTVDLATTSINDGTVRVFFGRGDGSFADGPQYALTSAAALAIGDLNRDGKPDIAAVGAGTLTILWRRP